MALFCFHAIVYINEQEFIIGFNYDKNTKMKNNINEAELINSMGNYIWVDLTDLKLLSHKPVDSNNKIVQIFISEHIELEFMFEQMSRLESLIGIYWTITRLRNYDASLSSQMRKIRDVESCEYEIETLSQQFNDDNCWH